MNRHLMFEGGGEKHCKGGGVKRGGCRRTEQLAQRGDNTQPHHTAMDRSQARLPDSGILRHWTWS